MPLDDIEVQLDTQPRPIVQFHAALPDDGSELLYLVEPRSQPAMFQDEEVGHRGAGMGAGCQGHRPIRVMRSQANIVYLGAMGDLQQLADAAAVRNVSLDNVDRSRFEPLTEAPAGADSLSRGNAHVGVRPPEF